MLSSFLHYGTGEPVLFLHGLFGMARNWGRILEAMAQNGWYAAACDLPNHGDSPWQESMSLNSMADDICCLVESQFKEGCAVVGHSLGGKVAMLMALQRPDLIKKLVIADIAPVTYPPRYRAYVKALLSLPIETFQRRSEADAALANIIEDRLLRLFLLQNLSFDTGHVSWRPNLGAIDAAMDNLASFPETRHFKPYSGPTLFLKGETSTYIKPEFHPLIVQLFPSTRFETVAKAGHWLHADQPTLFIAALQAFLQR